MVFCRLTLVLHLLVVLLGVLAARWLLDLLLVHLVVVVIRLVGVRVLLGAC